MIKQHCGVPDKCGALGGNEVTASVNDQHAVQCVVVPRINQLAGHTSTSALALLVYGESDVPQCYGSATFSEAVDICSAYAGGRLCSRDEMLDRCTRGTGCRFNNVLVWGCIANNNAETCETDAECCSGNCNVGTCSA